MTYEANPAPRRSAFGARTAPHAPYLPFAVPVGTGSVGWQAAAHPALSDMASVEP
jgi:hypothetical protein